MTNGSWADPAEDQRAEDQRAEDQRPDDAPGASRPAGRPDAAPRRDRPLPPPPYRTANPATPSAAAEPSPAAPAPTPAARPPQPAAPQLPPVPPPPPPIPPPAQAPPPVRTRIEGAARPRLLLPPVPPPGRRFVPGPDDTQLIPVLPAVPRPGPETDEELDQRDGAPGGSRGILRAAGTMAVASLVSRLTGLLRTVVIAAALGVSLVNDAYNTANTLPNLVYELLIGGVLTSVVVPLLVHAQERDRDDGVGYAQRLITVATVALTVMTGLAVLAAPLLTRLSGITGNPAQVSLANWLARILLLEILFYGLGALATAVLNSRGVFGAPAWAPVLNNIVVIATGVLFIAAGGPGELTPVTISSYQVWLLGIGTTVGIAVQALVLLPLLGRAGVPLRPRWGLRGTGLGEAGSLGIWVVAYAAISQVGVIVAMRVANAAGRAGGLGSSAYAIASLLFQMPYGIIGVALLTALLPRMSRAASRRDVPGVVADLALGTRLSATGLLPVTALLVVLGPAVATVAFARGNTPLADARGIGVALAVGAFGLLPMAITLLQLRVFYAMKDSRTPTLIQLAMVAVRVPLLLLVPAVVGPEHVVAGLMVATSVTYVAGWLAGNIALRRALGTGGSGDAAGTVLRMAGVSAVAALLGWLVVHVSHDTLGSSVAGSLGTLVIGTVVIGIVVVVGAVVAKVPEVSGLVAGVRARLGRPRSSHRPGA